METEKITIEVDAESARVYREATPEERRKMDLLLSLHLKQGTGPVPPLKQVMREISEKTQARGLTEEKLDELLREE